MAKPLLLTLATLITLATLSIPILYRDTALQQRAAAMRLFSEKEDRAYTAQALTQIQLRYWTRHQHSWYGKLQDSTLLRLDDPKILLAPLPSRAFYRGWHIQISLIANAWRTYPATPHANPFIATYDITRQSPTDWNIRVENHQITTPLTHTDALQITDAPQSLDENNMRQN